MILGRLFGRPTAPAQEDLVWADAAARWTGLATTVGAALPSQGVLVVVRGGGALDGALGALAALQPVPASDGYALDDAFPRLAARGLVVTLADVVERRAPAAAPKPLPAVHVVGRAERRSEESRLLAALQRWHPGPVVFHSALDDRLLREHAAHVAPLLARLGHCRDEPIASAMLGKALQRAQRD